MIIFNLFRLGRLRIGVELMMIFDDYMMMIFDDNMSFDTFDI